MTSRRIVVVAAVLTLAGVAALVAAGSRGSLDGPAGTLAFQRLVGGFGGDVIEANDPVDGATFLLLADLRSSDEAEDVLRWVEEGGRAVVADATSAIASSVGVSPAGFVSTSLLGRSDLSPACAVPEVVDVGRIRVRAVELGLSPGGDGIGCFPGADGSPHVVVAPHGSGRLVILGGSSVFWNEFLDEGDNAAFALRLVGGPGRDVVMGRPVPGARPRPGPWGVLPSPARTILIGLVLAALVFVMARGRRLGHPPEEPAASPIPASALVEATGALLRSSADREFVASQLREHHAQRLRRRLGLAPDLPPREVARAVDERRGQGHVVEELFSRPAPRDDQELLRLARDLQRTTRETEERP